MPALAPNRNGWKFNLRILSGTDAGENAGRSPMRFEQMRAVFRLVKANVNIPFHFRSCFRKQRIRDAPCASEARPSRIISKAARPTFIMLDLSSKPWTVVFHDMRTSYDGVLAAARDPWFEEGFLNISSIEWTARGWVGKIPDYDTCLAADWR